MTIDSESLELMNAEIDGRLSGSERQRLQALLERDALLRTHFERLKALSRVLAEDRVADPPRDLHQSIMRDIGKSAAAGRAGTLKRRIPPRVTLRYLYAIAAGLFLGIAGLSWYAGGIVGSPVDGREVAGSMSPRPGRPAPAPLYQVDIDSAGVQGTVFLTRHEGDYSLTLDLRADEPVGAILAFDPGQITLKGHDAEEGMGNLRLDESGLSWRMEGVLRVTIHLASRSQEAAEVRLGFEGPGGFVQAGEIILPPEN